MFRNIKVKLLFWYSLILLFILLSFSFSLVQVFKYQTLKKIDAQLLAVAYDIEHDVNKYLGSQVKDFDEAEEFYIKNLNILIYDKNQERVIKKSNSKLDFIKIKQNSFTLNKTRYINFLSKKEKNIIVQVSTSLEDKVDESKSNLLSTLLLVVPIVLIISILFAWLLINKALKPVRDVILEVEEIDSNDLKKRIKTLNSKDEIDELILTFNNMLEKIEKSFHKIKRFSNDASHELKTPLTIIRGELELGLRKDRTIDEYKNILNSCLEESIKLQELVDSLLFLSTSSTKEIQNRFKSFNIDELVIDIMSEYKLLLKKKSLKIELLKLDELLINGDETLIKVMISNILQNAVKYSNENSTIEISLYQNTLSIKDYGIGIKKEEQEKIFDRFYMVDKSRTNRGYGLGLSIVSQIALIHNIKIKLDSEYKKYTKFELVF